MKKNNFMMNKKMVGITLISLVVTIIILLILASISLTLILGDGGLLARAKNATDLYKQSEENDQIQLNNLYAELASATSSGINVQEMSDLIGQIVDNKIEEYNTAETFILTRNELWESYTSYVPDSSWEISKYGKIISISFSTATQIPVSTWTSLGILKEEYRPARSATYIGSNAPATYFCLYRIGTDGSVSCYCTGGTYTLSANCMYILK